eukprot:3349449-Amphidinium_carterae.1
MGGVNAPQVANSLSGQLRAGEEKSAKGEPHKRAFEARLHGPMEVSVVQASVSVILREEVRTSAEQEEAQLPSPLFESLFLVVVSSGWSGESSGFSFLDLIYAFGRSPQDPKAGLKNLQDPPSLGSLPQHIRLSLARAVFAPMRLWPPPLGSLQVLPHDLQQSITWLPPLELLHTEAQLPVQLFLRNNLAFGFRMLVTS